MKNPDVTLPNDFVQDVPMLGYPAVKLFFYFRLLRELSRNYYPDHFAWIRAGQDTILEHTGLKSKSTLLSARLELATLGWIADYRRGGYNSNGVNTTNRYLVMDRKLKNPNPELIKSWGGAVEIPEEEVKTPAYVVSLHEVRDELVEGK